MIGAFLTPQFRRFLLTGGVAAGVNLGSRYLFDRVLPFGAAVVLAYLCGMITAYVLARRYVFTAGQRRHLESSLRFALVNVLGIAQTSIVSIGLADFVFPALGLWWHAHDLAHLAGVAAPVFTSFIAHRHFTFAEQRQSQP
jgi:putative flippase GtrA